MTSLSQVGGAVRLSSSLSSVCSSDVHNGSPATLRTLLAVVIRPGAVCIASVLTSVLSIAVTDTVCTACSSTCNKRMTVISD